MTRWSLLLLAGCGAGAPAPIGDAAPEPVEADPDPVPMLVEPVIDASDEPEAQHEASGCQDGTAFCCNFVGCWCYPAAECACLAAYGDAGAHDYDAAIACSPIPQRTGDE